MKTGEVIVEKSRSVEDLHHMRLMALLRELARDKGDSDDGDDTVFTKLFLL